MEKTHTTKQTNRTNKENAMKKLELKAITDEMDQVVMDLRARDAVQIEKGALDYWNGEIDHPKKINDQDSWNNSRQILAYIVEHTEWTVVDETELANFGVCVGKQFKIL